MTTEITHTAFFGDQTHAFTLTDDMVAELERKAQIGIGALYLQFAAGQFAIATLAEIIRLGLIGAGTAPARAAELVDTYARNRPLGEIETLAFDVLDRRWNGNPTAKADGAGEAAA